MGLGKTLQTLSLIQYLKENDPKAGTGTLQRPFLVVCPLSVLSSWMTEAAKWTPGLKVVRFHGPVKVCTSLFVPMLEAFRHLLFEPSLTPTGT